MSFYGYLPHGLWGAVSSNDHAPQWCDGRYIWAFMANVTERFDTDTLYLSLMNSTDTANGESSLDSNTIAGSSIAYGEMSHVTGDDDFIYWLEPLVVNAANSDAHLGVLRRMSLADPFYVETVDNGWDTPSGYVAGSGNAPFYGLEQMVYVDGTSPAMLNGIATYDDYLYFTTVAFDAIGDYTYRICHWPLAGGDIRVLYEVSVADLVTGNSDVDEVRGGSWSYPWHGMGGPDLEGLDFSNSKLTVVGDSLILHNQSLVTTAAGRYPNANNVVFDLPSLLSATENDPLQHDRANPWYTMIHGGTGNYESGSSFNFETEDRFYAIRDGDKPLADTHLIGSGTAGRGELAGTFLFAEAAYFEGLQDQTANLFVHKLDPAETEAESIWNITLAFEGKALRGYGRQVILHGKEAPKEVTLK